jgi:hypothetical protein
MSTFEDFLRGCLDHGHTQVKLVPRMAADGSVAFYACGQCGPHSSDTFDGSVGGNEIGGPEEAEVAELAPVEPEVFTDGVADDFPPEEPVLTADEIVAFAAAPGEKVEVVPVEDEKTG